MSEPKRHIIIDTEMIIGFNQGTYYEFKTKCGKKIYDDFSDWKSLEKCKRCYRNEIK